MPAAPGKSLISLLLVAACAAPAGDAEEFRAAAAALCAKANGQTSSVVSAVFVDLDLPEEPTDEQLVLLYRTLATNPTDLRDAPQEMIAGLRGLEPPSDAVEFADWLDAVEQRFNTEWDLLLESSQSSAAARVQWDRDGSPIADLNEQALQLGLPECVFE